MSFLKAAGRKSVDIRSFLRESASGAGIRYRAIANEKHFIYIPYTIEKSVTEEGTEEFKSLIALHGAVHDWTADGRYRAAVCLEGVVRKDDDGNVINDGNCPMCNRVQDAWEIYNYRMELAKQTNKTGKELEKHLDTEKRTALDERKVREANDYIYILVAVFRMKGNDPILDEKTGLPEFDLKVMRMSTNRAEKIQKSVENVGVEFLGAEILFDYPDTEDIRQLTTNSTTTALLPQMKNSVVGKYEKVVDVIQKAAEEFEWEGIEKTFREWDGMTTEEAKITMNSQFRIYDQWKEDLKINPDAKYIEYLEDPSGGATKPEIVEKGMISTDPNQTFGDDTGIDIGEI